MVATQPYRAPTTRIDAQPYRRRHIVPALGGGFTLRHLCRTGKTFYINAYPDPIEQGRVWFGDSWLLPESAEREGQAFGRPAYRIVVKPKKEAWK